METIKSIVGFLKDLGTTAKDVMIGVAVFGLAAWLIYYSKPTDWSQIKAGKDGLSFVAKEAKENVAETAKELEKVRNDLIALQTRIGKSNDLLNAYMRTRNDPELKALADTLAGTGREAAESVARAADASRETAKAVIRTDELSARMEPAAAAAASNAQVGWYYLGKIGRDRRTWLPSSALGNLTFSPGLKPNTDQLQQLESGKPEVYSTGYKYLRSADENLRGRRVDAKIMRTLKPNSPVKIIEVDASGMDPVDGETVVWAKVQVL